ncbi:twin-arginine translocase subunit TatC [Cesiribacter sp. SM1]|uniref:twin-arginine translocase subunit TatC n=1 Tax=Cesiribacter sp. SM1 TaxID=2861196 RepID=UPI001CD3F874|nr:twin-arginine translocase subunit TatC [Cesiribacter sp. SM1]
MSFIDHLEELRWHLIRALIAVVVFTIAAFLAKDLVFHDIILGPSRTDFWTYRMMCKWGAYVGSDALCIDELPFILQSREMSAQFAMHITTSFVVGLICAFPYLFWEIWRFVSPALYDNERTLSTGAVFFVSLLFMLGTLFGYYLVAPLSINFLANYQVDPSIVNEFDINSYISTLTMLVLACALMFQLPMVVLFLTKLGVASPASMRAYRKISIVIILIVSAVITPPDVTSQILIALPLMLLYEISIYLSAIILRRERKKEAAELKALEERERLREAQEEKKRLEEPKKQLPLDQQFD